MENGIPENSYLSLVRIVQQYSMRLYVAQNVSEQLTHMEYIRVYVVYITGMTKCIDRIVMTNTDFFSSNLSDMKQVEMCRQCDRNGKQTRTK